MSEKSLMLKDLSIGYEGLFDSKELFKVLNKWLKENEYAQTEAEMFEKVEPEAKELKVVLKPSKEINDYAKIELKLTFALTNLKQVYVKKNDIKKELNQGKIKIKFEGYLITDLKNEWESRPYLFFLRVVFNKIVFKSKTNYWESLMKKDIYNLKDTLEGYLNLFKLI